MIKRRKTFLDKKSNQIIVLILKYFQNLHLGTHESKMHECSSIYKYYVIVAI